MQHGLSDLSDDLFFQDFLCFIYEFVYVIIS